MRRRSSTATSSHRREFLSRSLHPEVLPLGSLAMSGGLLPPRGGGPRRGRRDDDARLSHKSGDEAHDPFPQWQLRAADPASSVHHCATGGGESAHRHLQPRICALAVRIPGSLGQASGDELHEISKTDTDCGRLVPQLCRQQRINSSVLGTGSSQRPSSTGTAGRSSPPDERASHC